MKSQLSFPALQYSQEKNHILECSFFVKDSQAMWWNVSDAIHPKFKSVFFYVSCRMLKMLKLNQARVIMFL